VINERQYLKDSLYDVVDAIVKDNGRTDEVTWRDDNGVRPKAPFLSIEIVGGSRLGRPWRSKIKLHQDNPDDPIDPADMGEQTIAQPAKKTLTMYGFGEGSFDLLETVRDAVYMDKYSNMLDQAGLVILRTFDVTGPAAEIDGVREFQPHFDFEVAFSRVFTDIPGWIEHVRVKTDDLPMKPVEI
jgi:hypothetical protein